MAIQEKISEFKEKCLLFGGKGRIAEIMEDLLSENMALRQIIEGIEVGDISAEEIRDKIHSLEGEERLDGDRIKNITTYVSKDHFEGEGKSEDDPLKIKKNILDDVDLGKGVSEFIKDVI